MDDYIFISALNQYEYCPRRCYYLFVENTFLDNEHTVEGTLQHARADSNETSTRDGTLQLRGVHLYSRTYGITGKADVVEEKEGLLCPIEYKKGRRGKWTNDELQLCAQALCLEEMQGQEITQGYLFYAATGRRKEVQFTPELRQQTIDTISAVRQLIESGQRPPNPYTPRCKGCSLSDICLPRETAQLHDSQLKRPSLKPST